MGLRLYIAVLSGRRRALLILHMDVKGTYTEMAFIVSFQWTEHCLCSIDLTLDDHRTSSEHILLCSN